VNPVVDENAPKVSNIEADFGNNQPNGWDEHYPVPPAEAPAMRQEGETVAPPPVVDPEQKASHGLDPEPVVFDRVDQLHPMEVKTPLPFQMGLQDMCDQNIVINVSVPAAQFLNPNDEYPTLPTKYGCYNENEFAREKASPEVVWENVYEDVTDMTLQMISMGDKTCPGPAPADGENTGAGKVLWDVTDIQPSGRVVFAEGASHDSRTLNGGKEQPNQWLEEYYSGPCPPVDVTECYRFMVVAHRGEGKKCQCGHVDVLFTRPVVKVEQPDYIYKGTVFDAEAPPDAIPEELLGSGNSKQ